jgi:hypothetical protein
VKLLMMRRKRTITYIRKISSSKAKGLTTMNNMQDQCLMAVAQ